jgi:hypothetical protein
LGQGERGWCEGEGESGLHREGSITGGLLKPRGTSALSGG